MNARYGVGHVPPRPVPAPRSATQMFIDNSDGSSTGHAEDELLDDTGWLLLQGLALVAFVVSVVALISICVGR
jgi:hypothetical protein